MRYFRMENGNAPISNIKLSCDHQSLVIPVPVHGPVTSTTHILVFYRNLQTSATLKSFEGYVV